MLHQILDWLASQHQHLPLDGTQLIKCPGSEAHVWDIDQCDSFDFGADGRGSGGGRRGLLGWLTGGLL